MNIAYLKYKYLTLILQARLVFLNFQFQHFCKLIASGYTF